MLIEKLKQWSYYKSKLPLYFQNSYGIDEHFKMLVDVLLQVDFVADEVMKGFDIFNEMYLDYINSLDDSIDKDQSDILDKIGALYGVTRTFDVTYIVEASPVTENLHLNNSEFLKLIKARAIQNNFRGTYEESREFYNNIKLPIYLFNSINEAEVHVYLDTSVEVTDNEQKLFLANLLTLKSMGISYQTVITEIVVLFTWDSSSAQREWDEGAWL